MAYGLTKSGSFASASLQNAKKTSSLTGFWTGSGNRSIEGWFKLTTLPSAGGLMYFADFGDDGTNNGEINLSIKNNGGAIHGYVDVYNRAVEGTVNLAFTTGVWYHYAITYDGTNFKWYVNGVLQDTAAAGTITTPASPIVGVGSRTINDAYGGFINGSLSLVRFWKEARSAANLLANMCSVLGSTTNLAAEYTLDNVFTDNSGNSNTLTASVLSPTFATDLPGTCTIVGPTNVKTWDGVTQSTGVKTYEGVALASVKSVNGVA